MARRDTKVRKVDPLLEVRHRFKNVLATAGLTGLFERMPSHVRTQVFESRCPDPLLVFAPGWPTDAAHAALRKRVDDAWWKATFIVDGHRVLIRDFVSIIAGVQGMCAHNVNVQRSPKPTIGMPESVMQFMLAASERLAVWLTKDSTDAMFNQLFYDVVCPVLERGRLDTRMFRATFVQEHRPRRGYQCTMTIHTEPPQTKRVTIDGQSRPMVRVGSGGEWHGMQWASLDGALVGRPGVSLPVYAQSHALKQLQARINLETHQPWAEYWMHKSLTEPVVAQHTHGDLMLQYRMQDKRVGYLIVTPLEDCAVVRTFLFLTMDPSPEARLLEQKLKLTRHEAQWLGLHDLAAFTKTDMKDDDELRRLFKSCGCGQLFDLAEDDWLAPDPKPKAAEVREYLGMAA